MASWPVPRTLQFYEGRLCGGQGYVAGTVGEPCATWAGKDGLFSGAVEALALRVANRHRQPYPCECGYGILP